ncbi:hypothetical protein TNCT1_23010 [Streptomyces sp. 1-11]|nr:hypothetical protein TNCT1_23010 [Streptomyces sp. 1-11]
MATIRARVGPGAAVSAMTSVLLTSDAPADRDGNDGVSSPRTDAGHGCGPGSGEEERATGTTLPSAADPPLTRA